LIKKNTNQNTSRCDPDEDALQGLVDSLSRFQLQSNKEQKKKPTTTKPSEDSIKPMESPLMMLPVTVTNETPIEDNSVSSLNFFPPSNLAHSDDYFHVQGNIYNQSFDDLLKPDSGMDDFNDFINDNDSRDDDFDFEFETNFQKSGSLKRKKAVVSSDSEDYKPSKKPKTSALSSPLSSSSPSIRKTRSMSSSKPEPNHLKTKGSPKSNKNKK